jgi:protoheme IX farnesyltransferase
MTAMFIAKGGWPGLIPFLGVAFGFYMAAGSANAINMVIDRDIDGRMKRTATRATVTQQMSSRNALLFAFMLELASFVLLWTAANLLSAMLALAGLVYYVVIYTLLLKRRTWNNIVIGGAAGAFPPLVGWAAVTNDLSILAWLLFAIIFLWTPVHFWALAILLKDDYAEAGVPMLPVVHGERATTIHISVYTVLTVLISVAPVVYSYSLGWFYLVTAVLLNAVLVWYTIKLYQRPDRPRASSLFHYSMLYLALLFLAMAIDRAVLPSVVKL